MMMIETEASRSEHPVDVIERVAAVRAWTFARDDEDEICISVDGSWSPYQLSFTWLEGVEALHLACAFDVKINERRRNELYKLVSLINEQLWVGHFGIWEKEGVVIFRHTLILAGGLEPTTDQCEAAIEAGVQACDRYYQCFNFVLWSGRTAKEALDTALFDTVGEA